MRYVTEEVVVPFVWAALVIAVLAAVFFVLLSPFEGSPAQCEYLRRACENPGHADIAWCFRMLKKCGP